MALGLLSLISIATTATKALSIAQWETLWTKVLIRHVPRLPRDAFSAATLEGQLDAAARMFIGENRNVWIDHGKREVWLSAIFDFYTQDFLAHAPSLFDYINRYRAAQVPGDFKVYFLEYRWTVNHRKWAYVR
jgi:hypothetical protein